MITYNDSLKTFYLNTDNSSYIIKILDNGMICHWYYGASISEDNLDYCNLLIPRSYSSVTETGNFRFSQDNAMFEYPTFGTGDYRNPAVSIENCDGRAVNDLIYISHSITKGAKAPEGLPSFDCNTENADTLEISAQDTVSGAVISLFYTVYSKEDAIGRYTVIHNITDKKIKIRSAYSLSLDFNSDDFELITLQGAWGRERHINRRKITHGNVSIESRRGASGHQNNPFAALVSPDTTEDSGEVYGFSLVYSGNFKISAETDQYSNTRMQVGINPFNFTYVLEKNEEFTTPQAISVYSNKGLNRMSHCFHNMCRNHLGKCTDRTVKRPILINSWEAMYFNMSEEIIKNFVNNCKGLGIDTFVLDDGWFGHRDCDDSSLGDWFVDKNKFPEGMHNIIKACKDNGMNFGIWFEPEMISADSRLYKEHPDWCIHVNGKAPTESRNQLVLDMSRPCVVNCIYDQIAAILNEYDISYIKWDMNRNITDNGSDSLEAERQGEHSHRYISGVYSLMDRLVKNFPNVLFEGCAGGGGRFDFGILYYMPQFWTSDDTDAIERLKIQYGTSLVYPLSSMTAHVSACPNHQTGRVTPFKTRGDVAQVCNFGYELDIGKLSDEEKNIIKQQTALHRQIEPLILNGDFYRLESPFEKEYCSWEIVSEDKKNAFVVFASQKTTPNNSCAVIKLRGLDENKVYSVSPLNIKAHGNTLMNAGIPITYDYSDFKTVTFELTAE